MNPDLGTEPARLSTTVVNIQRMSTEDGPGLRTTVFLKGCSLDCCWCHNPETRSPRPQLVWHDWKCVKAGVCDAVCPEDAIQRRDGAVQIDFERCTMCGVCADECPTTALEVIGKRWQVDDLATEVLKDRTFFEASGGGVTVSGGEPALQPAFTLALLERCRTAGVHVAVDTCGMCSRDALRQIAACADLVLYDLKEIDPAQHARFTKQSNERILANLLDLAERMRGGQGPAALWVRTPLVPGATAREPNILGIGAFLAANLTDLVARWELCAFNNPARDKYRRLGMHWAFEETPLLTPGELESFAAIARRSGFDPARVVASGPTAVDIDAGTRTVAAAQEGGAA